MVYGLLPDKQQETYFAMFNFLFSFIENCPKSVMIDFEIGIHNALIEAGKAKFNSMIIIQGCYFHLVRNLWKHVQKYKLVDKYEEKEFRRLYRLTKALAFLPPKHVITGFKAILEICTDDFKPILDYFEEYYKGWFISINKWFI